MKSSTKPISETRKIRKPLMEKKRRARINDSLETLKQILLDSKANNLSSSSLCKRRKNQRSAKLEKADILEMTVNYIQDLQSRLVPEENPKDLGDNRQTLCEEKAVKLTLLATRLNNGDLAYVIPNSKVESRAIGKLGKNSEEQMWRPW